MKKNKASQWALVFVLVVFGGSFVWWFQNRPSYLLYQAHSQLGTENQPVVIARYKRLLSKKKASPEEEIRLRLALGEFYLKASGEIGTVVLRRQDPAYDVDHPFIQAAQDEFKRVLELDEKNAVAHYHSAHILLLRKLESFAIEELNLALQVEPDFSQALQLLSLIHQERGKPELGRNLALQALAIEPGNDAARWALVQAHTRLGEPVKAQKEYRKLSEPFKASPSVRSFFAVTLAEQNQWRQAEREIETALNRNPKHHWVRVNHARILLMQGQVDEAFGELVQAEKLFKKSPWPIVWATRAHTDEGRCSEAGSGSNLLVSALPRWPWSHLAKAWTHLCRGDDRAAMSSLNNALRFSSQFQEASLAKAHLYIDKGRYEQLGRLIRPWLDEKRNQTVAYTLLSESLVRQKKWSLAKETAESAIQCNPESHRAYIWLGVARAESGEMRAAERAFHTARRLNPYDPDVKSFTAYSQSLQKNWEEANQSLSALLLTHPHNAEVWVVQGKVQASQGHWAEAIRAFKNGIARKPYLLEAQLNLMDAYWNDNQRDAADGVLSDALKLNSQHPDVLAWRARLRPSL